MAYTKAQFDQMQKELYSAVIADILDDMGYRNFNMDSALHPILDSTALMGYVRPVLSVDVYEIPEEVYKLELEFIDTIKENDVIVATVNGKNENGFFGELLTTAAIARGGRGVVIDGHSRDVVKINELGFPLYCRGMNPLDSKGRVDVIAYDKPMNCAGVQVKKGDIIFADIDGIVVVPGEVAEEVIEKAMAKVSGENLVREELRKGRSAKEVFEQYGIL